MVPPVVASHHMWRPWQCSHKAATVILAKALGPLVPACFPSLVFQSSDNSMSQQIVFQKVLSKNKSFTVGLCCLHLRTRQA